ncbi:hypothetical protein ACHAWT_005116 [Skeletonema menzelii]
MICTRQVHFNNAGASPSPKLVIDTTIEHMRLESEVGAYRAAELACDKVERVYKSVAQLIGAGNNIGGFEYNARNEIALTESATVSWTRVFYSMLERKERELMPRQDKQEMIILVSEAEYAANVVAAVKFARDHTKLTGVKWRVVGIPSSFITNGSTRISTGIVDLESLRSILDGKVDDINPASIAMICITHVPTNCHIVNPISEIGNMIHDFNKKEEPNNGSLPRIFYLVDACQSVGQLVIDVKHIQCHALAATGRKYLRGPRGTGFLYVQKETANALQPSHVDHTAAPVVRVMAQPSNKGVCVGLEEESERGLLHSYQPGAARFEFWEANIAARLGLGAAIDVSLAIGVDKIEKLCSTYGQMLRNRLVEIDRVNVYRCNHHEHTMCGIVTFWCDGIEALTVKERLQNDDRGDGCCFHLSVVPATSTPLDSSRTGLGMKQLLRASLSYFNTEAEIFLFCKALQSILHSIAQQED